MDGIEPAAEIGRLRARIAELDARATLAESRLSVAVEALRPFASMPVVSINRTGNIGDYAIFVLIDNDGKYPTFEWFDRARAALKEIEQ